MSGGSWDYVYCTFEDVAERLLCQGTLRAALGRHIHLIAEAMHAIEWNDSGDGADEVSAINAVFGNLVYQKQIEILAEQLEDVMKNRKAI